MWLEHKSTQRKDNSFSTHTCCYLAQRKKCLRKDKDHENRRGRWGRRRVSLKGGYYFSCLIKLKQEKTASSFLERRVTWDKHSCLWQQSHEKISVGRNLQPMPKEDTGTSQRCFLGGINRSSIHEIPQCVSQILETPPFLEFLFKRRGIKKILACFQSGKGISGSLRTEAGEAAFC